MQKSSLILGGTKGLGRAIAIESLKRDIKPVIVGRSIDKASKDPALAGARFSKADLNAGTRDRFDVETAMRIPLYHYGDCPDYVFMVSGMLIRKRFVDCGPKDINRILAVNLGGIMRATRAIHDHMLHRATVRRPYHLVIVASTSSWRMRENETVYCVSKAGEAAFARQFARELARDLPGSKATLVNPGGMKTELFEGTGQDISKFMEPDAVAKIIWDEVLGQADPFKEIQIMRDDDGAPRVAYGPRTPEQPF